MRWFLMALPYGGEEQIFGKNFATKGLLIEFGLSITTNSCGGS